LSACLRRHENERNSGALEGQQDTETETRMQSSTPTTRLGHQQILWSCIADILPAALIPAGETPAPLR
jgi:hypothetical protein